MHETLWQNREESLPKRIKIEGKCMNRGRAYKISKKLSNQPIFYFYAPIKVKVCHGKKIKIPQSHK